MNALTTTTPTVTSLELVEIINSMRGEDQAELRHDNFMAKIENHPGVTSPKFLGHVLVPGPNGAMRKSKCYHLPKREAELMVMSESLGVQTKVYDRMTALESTVKAAIPHRAAQDAAKAFPAFYRVARLIGCDKNAAAISANQAVAKVTGENVLALLGVTHLEAPNQEAQWFTPTELGQRIGVSARNLNLLLADSGMQMKHGDVWEVTAAGHNFSRLYDTGKKHGSGVPVQQVKWSAAVLPVLEPDSESAG